MEMMAYYGSLLECAKRSKIKTNTEKKNTKHDDVPRTQTGE